MLKQCVLDNINNDNPISGSWWKAFLWETTQSLTELPQLLCGSIIFGFIIDFSHSAVGEIASAERFNALLESTVQGVLGSLDSVLEEICSHRFQEQLKYWAGVPCQLGVDSSCKNRKCVIFSCDCKNTQFWLGYYICICNSLFLTLWSCRCRSDTDIQLNYNKKLLL